ncbi:hypothetical protein [Aurantiacibacter poecillastricola]|uniref:hypothetical protein n=1 Tax=Aurantiacibacter poecillastricola TaxID=3064385 RepID=UPI00273E3B89|nr:hypothetical protein [Aurantiacibacter sp. 219JJ12-13]MDP5261766.1 hypothetical protein [Aurantiacibacter sp. 219JJ12-13]
MWILWVLLAILLIAAMSGGLALGMHLLFPRMAERARILWAAGLAAFLPMSLAFGGFFLEAEIAQDDFLLSLVALVLLSFLILSVCCLPPAWWATTRLGRGTKEAAPQIDSDDPELIEG